MSQLFERFSSRDNLKKAYFYVQNELALSSLSVNPINNPAITAINDIGDRFFSSLERYLRDGKYKPERGFFVYMPKDNLALRPVCVTSMIDRIVYQAIFNQDILGYKIDGQLSEKVCYANRVSDDEKSGQFLSQYFNGWDDFCKEQKKAFQKKYIWKLEVDVQQYYEHIPVERLIKKLSDDFGITDGKILAILKEQLCTWAEYKELPKGIPQGPNASAVLGNVYLSSLDRYAEKELVGKELKYFRYADDITLMGKSKEAVLKATEKIVRFLREDNLNLNEKTKLAELESVETIEAMRIFSEYDEDTPEIPQDDFTQIQERVPDIIALLQAGERIDKSDIRELKYFLKVDTTYGDVFMMGLIELIPLRPSLTVPIVQYVSEGRKTLDAFDASVIDYVLWKIYNESTMSEWSRFWIFKLLVSNKDVLADGIEDEVERILASKENSIFKIVCFYYKIIQNGEIDIEQIKQAVEGSETDIEKSIYSFFLLNAFQNARIPVIKSQLEKLLNYSSNELNLIGSYLFKNTKRAKIDDFGGDFSNYLLKSPEKRKKAGKNIKTKLTKEDTYVLVRTENLIPITSPSAIFGVSRIQRKKHTEELNFPEIVRWEKVTLKMKDGLKDIEIFYDDKLIKRTDYKKLGFYTGIKQEKPDRQWGFLCALSVLSTTNIQQATADKMRDMVAVNSQVTLRTGNVHQIKRTLVKRLRAIFKTSDNPFIDRRDYYQPVFTILPESDLRKNKIWKKGGKLNENREYEEDGVESISF